MSNNLNVLMAIQPTVSHYRAPLIRELFKSQKINFSLLGRFQDTDQLLSEDMIHTADREILKRVKKLRTTNWGPVRWEHGVIKTVIRSNYDAYILEGRVYNLSTWIILLLARILKKRVFLWGHGWKRQENGIKLLLRLTFYSLSNGLLVYGNKARSIGIKSSIPSNKITVVNNSIYSRQTILNQSDLAFMIDSQVEDTVLNPTFIVSCRLTSRHKLELLASAIDLLPVTIGIPKVIIVGTGSQMSILRQIFHQTRCDEEFMGAVYDPRVLAGLYSQADIAVSPAASGLNIVQSLGFGVPIVVPFADSASGPEEEIVVDGRTGCRFEEGSAASLADTLLRMIQSRSRLQQMGQEGRRIVLSQYTSEAHAKHFEDAICKWVIKK